MKPKEVHKLSDEELDIEVKRMRRKLYEVRCQAVTEKIHDTSLFGKIRRDLARMLTEQTVRRGKTA
jgi:ribosomal protein L29